MKLTSQPPTAQKTPASSTRAELTNAATNFTVSDDRKELIKREERNRGGTILV